MAITEPSRHQLYQRLEVVLGPQEATTLMEHLPPVGWANVATKDDVARLHDTLSSRIAVLEERMESRFAKVASEFAQVESQFAQMATQIASVDERSASRFDILEARIDAADANMRSYVDRAIRTNMVVTIGVLGTLTSAVTILANL